MVHKLIRAWDINTPIAYGPESSILKAYSGIGRRQFDYIKQLGDLRVWRGFDSHCHHAFPCNNGGSGYALCVVCETLGYSVAPFKLFIDGGAWGQGTLEVK